MTLRLNGSNSGFTEVKAPATAGSNTITLPTSNGSASQYLRNSSTAGELEFGALPTLGYTASATTLTTSGNTHTVTGLDTSATHFIVAFSAISVSGSGTPQMVFQLGNGSLSNSGYECGVAYQAAAQNGTGTDVDLIHSNYSSASNSFSGALYLVCNAGDAVVGNWIIHGTSSNPIYGAFTWTGGTAIDRFSLQTAATAFDAGRFKIYSR